MTLTPEKVTEKELVRRFCRGVSEDIEEISKILDSHRETFNPDGFILIECQMMDSSRNGEELILPYGGAATIKTVPTGPFSPRGLASDMSVVKAFS